MSVKNFIVFDYLMIDNDVYCVIVDGKEVNLILKEYELLCYFVKMSDKVYDREQLLCEVWYYDFFGDFCMVDMYVKCLCEKLNCVLL